MRRNAARLAQPDRARAKRGGRVRPDRRIAEKTPPDADRGVTDAVTRRAALFASFGDEDALKDARKVARELYGCQ